MKRVHLIALTAAMLVGLTCTATAGAAGPAPGTLSILAGVNRFPTAGPANATPLGAADVASDSSGNLYIADTTANLIEKVTPAGQLSIIAGNGSYGRPAPGPATSSPLSLPTAVALDAAGDVFISDVTTGQIVKVTPGGTLSVVAGGGTGATTTPGTATQTALHQPHGLSVDAAGDLFFAETLTCTVDKVTPGGVLSIVAGTGTCGTETAGAATASELGNPDDVAVDANGDLYIADTGNQVIEKVTPGGQLSVIAGTGRGAPAKAGAATASPLDQPEGVAVDGSGDVLIADTDNAEVEKVTPTGTLSIIAGSVRPGLPTPGPATSSLLREPVQVANGPSGSVLIADDGAGEVVAVGASGTLSIRAGRPSRDQAVPGPAVDSPLNTPLDVAADAAGDVFIADEFNDQVEEVSPSGTLSIAVGNGQSDVAQPGPATDSTLGYPIAVAVDGQGNLYVATENPDQVVKVTPAGTLSVIAGDGDADTVQPGPATQSPLGRVGGIAVDPDGNVYLADYDNDEILEVTPAGTLSIVAGNGSSGKPVPGRRTRARWASTATHSALDWIPPAISSLPTPPRTSWRR